MSNATALRAGEVGSDEFALFLKVYAGEVLTAFDELNISMPHVTVRSIDHGKSA